MYSNGRAARCNPDHCNLQLREEDERRQMSRYGLWVNAPGGPVAAQERVYVNEIRRVDYAGRAHLGPILNEQCLWTPIPAPARGVLTGVAPFKPLSAEKARINRGKLRVMQEENGTCMVIQHATAMVKILEGGEWQCMRNSHLHGRTSHDDVNMYRIHVVGLRSRINEKVGEMRCVCGKLVLMMPGLWGCDACTDTYLRHEEDITKEVIFESQYIKANTAINTGLNFGRRFEPQEIVLSNFLLLRSILRVIARDDLHVILNEFSPFRKTYQESIIHK
ncbi:hypothetical protein QAD02_022025 [Eretmocerus hayati]|uniref:Uncharacterized protein n=1 Tax=Eretmocerus hayati TaxID=131215 RepID=A0ACC2PTW8_9HYME|nr:hypothetical protein QAD02_022025 [Eretmocerus hayati]